MLAIFGFEGEISGDIREDQVKTLKSHLKKQSEESFQACIILDTDIQNVFISFPKD